MLVRRGSGLRSQSQNRVEGIHWVEPAVKAEDVLVEVGREPSARHGVVDAPDAVLGVAEETLDSLRVDRPPHIDFFGVLDAFVRDIPAAEPLWCGPS